MNINQAEEILYEIFEESAKNVLYIEMGQLSKVFSFEVKEESYIAHFRNNKESFDKAEYMFENYGHKLPIPKVVKRGKIGEIFYNISSKAKGKSISSYSNSELNISINDLAKQFINMSHIYVEPSKGFGMILPNGRAANKSWKAVLGDAFKENQEGFFKDWTNLYTESFLEKSLFQEGYSAIMELAKYSPEKPSLVHGDFHLGNMISDGSRVTGFVDWELAMYGDFMFDLAVLHLWTPHLNFPQKIRELLAETEEDIEHFNERLRCNMLFKAIDGLRFFAKQGSKPSYDYIKEKVVSLLNEI
jgi:hygromycin-B 4-O-kinase